jgi:hypothetical protein
MRSKTVLTFLTVVAAALVALSASAGAAEIPIVNAGFESAVLTDGNWSYDQQGWGWVGADEGGSWNPDNTGAIYYGYGGIAPEGQNVGFAVSGDGVDGGFAQVLTETLTANTKYTLTVEVGNNSYYAWGGYKVQLLAGGTPGDEGEIIVGTLLAEDDDSVTVAADTFETSTVTFDSTGVDAGLLGQPLQIRLLGKPGTGEIDLDDVKLFASLARAATLVAPIEWAYVDLDLLKWARPDPLVAGDTISVNVYFGTDPNLIPDVNGSVQIEAGQDIDETGAFAGYPLVAGTDYYWRVDCIDPNGGTGDIITTGETWTFATIVPPAIIVTESGDSTEVREEDRIANRDDYILSLTKDPGAGVSVSITISEEHKRLTTTRETMVSFDSEPANAPELQVTHSGGTAVSSRVSSSLDGTEEWEPDSMNYASDGDLQFFHYDGRQIIGLRFNNVEIPQGAIVDSAIVEFEVAGTNATGQVHGVVTGEDVDNAPALVAEELHLTNRLAANPTTATSSFAWTADYAVNDKVPTPDIASVIQEIVDRDGWNTGNSILLIFTDDTTLEPDDIEFIDATDPWAPRSSTYVLNHSNWEAGVTVTVAAIDDSLLEADPEGVTVITTASSNDPDWDGLSVADVTVFVLENECGAWGFNPLDLNTDCVVDIADLAIFASQFGTCTDPQYPGLCDDHR